MQRNERNERDTRRVRYVNVRGARKYCNRVIESTNFVSTLDKRTGNTGNYTRLNNVRDWIKFRAKNMGISTARNRYEISIRRNPFGSSLDLVRSRFQYSYGNCVFENSPRTKQLCPSKWRIIVCEISTIAQRLESDFFIRFPISIHFLPIFAYLFLASCLNKDSSFLFRSIFSISAYL